jgi:ribonuclease R
MDDLAARILAALAEDEYQPLKPKALARHLGIPATQYNTFRQTLRDLVRQGRIAKPKGKGVRTGRGPDTLTGVFRKTGSGLGFVRPHTIDGHAGPEIAIRAGDGLDAATGDTVLVRITRKARGGYGPSGRVVEVIERATRQFVGTYFERDGQGYVRVDGSVFAHSVWVGDPGAKGARPSDKVVLEMLRFPSTEERGEGVVVEILGARGEPGVDTLSVIRAYGLPDEFPEDVLREAREQAANFNEEDLDGRTDFTQDLVITIDPVDARDFDDAVGLTRDEETGHWQLSVHIADVAHFAPPGSVLDREARKRGTSVYLPQRVLPMFPEVISNSLASLQQSRLRYVKSAVIDYAPDGARTKVTFYNGAIRVRQRFAYEQVSEFLADPQKHGEGVEPEVAAMLERMRDLAMILRKRRLKHGALELDMPEPELEYDERGRVSGAHFRKHDVSHQVIEEFMLAANEAVAEHFDDQGVAFLRRVHPSPDEFKLKAFSEFVKSLGYKTERHMDRFSLQRILRQSADRPDRYAVHYALLRSLKQAVYSPLEEEHYALAIKHYCHFTSPIRRYPDLTVHRMLGQWLARGKVGADAAELAALGEHCSKTERRAEAAERELVKVRLLNYLSERIGLELEVIITGVADYGFFGQPETLPVEGLVHISTLTDDYYHYDDATHSLTGRKHKHRYRLGDKVTVTVVRVDLARRQLDFRVVARKK